MPGTHICDLLITNVRLATRLETRGENSGGNIHDAAIAVKDGRIAWIGAYKDLPSDLHALSEHDGKSCWVTPGLIDCHSHVVYAGNRSNEFEARLNGATYEEIALQGGGIISTVKATRAASEDELLRQSLPRVVSMMAEGVTTLEIKSGYGLSLEAEAKMLRVARRIGQLLPVTVKTTFLGAHAVPPEYAGYPDAYIDAVCDTMLPALADEGLIDAIDVFCEKIGFSPAQTERMFRAALQFSLPVKLHAEQLSDMGGSLLAAQYKALSSDHLEYLSDAGIAAMAASRTVAVLLPGAWYFLRETKLPPVAAMRSAGLRMAVATDSNPGTSPMTSLLLAMNMACTLFGLTPQEALAGTTINAAHALGLGDTHGSLAVGKVADLALWEIEDPRDLAYAIGFNPCRYVVNAGRVRLPVVPVS